jgi:hypothetical protein
MNDSELLRRLRDNVSHPVEDLPWQGEEKTLLGLVKRLIGPATALNRCFFEKEIDRALVAFG